ncbi:SDR family NAD(P)-dependent oxidoreductase [Chitinophaga nivalis]|uniref:SDR family NAD(P)-dependent oxidoreductase n=1 Tax=Chitinophaga nivalis TaxID=2991709 RepID=A0ABT3IIU8_9BACT|nr:SDR family NAD(P)-dependent oxidoreductase [Chitinophaga nivalis]MCW3466426.1 SDR family NAD(P)-dependent oxidoreductase [Chitinophaga nivalis]MCW3483883.1 SDR family NAD(P)-dependent oxidoreductase [Chitinophaga nivalis]
MKTAIKDIAVIGMACRFPGAKNYEAYWQNLIACKSCITDVPMSRWNWRDYTGNPLTEKNKSNSKWGGFIDDVTTFDAAFFSLSGKEAEAMDPQQRIMLELSWACFEDAGLQPARYSGTNVGVYTGIFNFDYKEIQEKKEGNSIEAHHATGTAAAIIPNRISYYYNFRGPSVPVDTACSSSLHAIHLAIQSLQLNECEMALAGGINLILTPTRHISFSKTGMLSPTGSCKSFDESADGYVRSEGAGLLLLKPLDKALADGNHIYGVLKGSAVNHGGKNYTLTYPGQDAQSAVIAGAIRKAGVDPATITYIEAHGTGTPKGDPIEFGGLSNAFASLMPGATHTQPFCALGSVKANIGHLESAAGVAGVIKVLLSMKYGTLPGQHHFKKLNPRISLENTPFYILAAQQEWKRITDENGHTLPRRAGVSSFGFGGTNAHVVLEEVWPSVPSPAIVDKHTSYPVFLSAKTPEALARKEQELLQWVAGQHTAVSLQDISATLLLGRTHFDYRSAFIATDVANLLEILHTAPDKRNDYWTGKAPEKKTSSQLLLQEVADNILQKLPVLSDAADRLASLKMLAELYVQQGDAAWRQLYEEEVVLLPLPSYPFEKEYHWVSDEDPDETSADMGTSKWLHPLIHENITDFSAWQYRSGFDGQEPFLKDHVVNGQAVLPAVAYLEMMRYAAQYAWGYQDTVMPIAIKNVAWTRPLLVTDSRQVYTKLLPQDNDTINCEVYTDDGNGQQMNHGQATISRQLPDISPAWPLSAAAAPLHFPAATCYELLSRMGFSYGPTHRLLDHLQINGEQLTGVIKQDHPGGMMGYQLHPGIMDAALQAALLLLEGRRLQDSREVPVLLLPFAIREVVMYKSCTAHMHVQVKHSAERRQQEHFHTMDISLYNEAGEACIVMQGVAFRKSKGNDAVSGHMFKPVWQQLSRSGNMPATPVRERMILLLDTAQVSAAQLSSFFPGVTCKKTGSGEGAISDRYTADAITVFNEVQQLLQARKSGKILLQIVLPDTVAMAPYAGLAGLLKTAHQENPLFHGQLLKVPADTDAQTLSRYLSDSVALPAGELRIQQGKPEWLSWEEISFHDKVVSPWKNKGVYLITGGLGSLGVLFAKEILHHTENATVILCGRSPLDHHKQQLLASLQVSGKIDYVETDISEAAAVTGLIQDILHRYGALNGVLHAAGILRDSFIIKKTKEEITTVFAPKVNGLVYLDEATREVPLDYFILFSSTSGALGNAGQADYAMANAFMDGYADYSNSLSCHHNMISVNWPLWKEGGMQIDNASMAEMKEKKGIVPMSVATGLQALNYLLTQDIKRAMILEGEGRKIREHLLPVAATTTPARQEPDPADRALLLQLQTAIGALLNVPAAEIDVDVPVLEYGLDRIALTKLVDNLNSTYELTLNSQWLYRYETIREMTAALQEVISVSIPPVTVIPAAAPVVAAAVANEEELQPQTILYLKKLLSKVLKVNPNRIEAESPMENYGIDSVMVVQLTNQLENVFGPLSRTLFFEYLNIKELAGYFVAEHRNRLTALLYPGAGQQPAVTETALKLPQNAVTAVAPPPVSVIPEVPEKELQNAENRHPAGEMDIAIIGLAGKYPGADDIGAFWKNLQAGKDSITEIPVERWDYSRFYDPDKTRAGKSYSKWGGFISDVDAFDPLYFNISPREAETMDPQERLFLECAMATLEDAGYTRERLNRYTGSNAVGNVGVFTGVMYSEYQLYAIPPFVAEQQQALWGIASSIANRVSYYCNFHGPSMAVDTMCSSSLTAIHIACQSIQQGDCELALAGGVNVSVHPNKYIFLSQGRFVSSKGRCESFGEGGDGYVPGEGVGAVLLKPLSKAVADGDHIYGVIKSSVVNHGGKTNGYTVPNPIAQAGVIGHAFRRSGIDPATISYIEAHGTGTSLGDPIEITGLKKAFEAFTAAKQFCAIGSAKSNIGHCESAAGIAGLTKILLQLQHRQLVPSLHSQQLNSHIDFNNSPFVVQQTLAAWKRPVLTAQGVTRELPLRAGLSSFGAGGSNAHLVIEEYSMPEKAVPMRTSSAPYLLVFSARTQERLTVVVQRFLHYLQTENTAPLADIAFTLQTGREGLEERLGILVTDISSAIAILTAYLSGETAEDDIYRGSIREDKDSLWMMQDEDFRKAAIDSCIQKGKYDRLLELWTKGYDLDWELLYPAGFPSRVSLPTYPFARERYWFRQPVPAVSPVTSTDATVLLQKQWVPVSLTEVRPHSQQVVILVTASGRELGAAIQAQLAHSIVAEVSQVETLPIATGGVIDLTGYGYDDTDLIWLEAVQHLIETGPRSGMRFLGVTSDLENYKHTAAATTGALHAGLYRLLGAEYKYISSCHLDVLSGLPVDLLATAVIRAFQWEGEATSLCFREGQYYECVLDTAAPAAPRTVRFTGKDVLVVTGGTRGIGYLCAQHFITRYGVRHVLLTGREQLPPRSEWEQHIAMDGRYASKLRSLLLLTAGGVTVEAVAVDLTSAAAIGALVANVHAGGKQIGGVLHAAGLIDMETPAFIRKTVAGIAQVLSPKVAGLQALYAALQHEPLQCFLLFSSVSAQIPALGSGQSDYAMANAYMDYFAQSHGPLLQSIQWPNWKETGMGEVKNAAYTRTGLLAFSNQTGLDLLDELLAQHIGPVVMPAVFVPGEWHPAKLLRKEAALPAATAVPVTFIPPAVPANPTGNTTGWLTNIFTKELKIDPDRFDTQRSFPDYGVDSVLLSQILGHINRALGEQLDPSVLLEHTTVATLSRWLEKQYPQQLAALAVPAETRTTAAAAPIPVSQEIPVSAIAPPVITAAVPYVPATPLATPVPPATAAVTAAPLAQPSVSADDIAVIGYSCRFPGADNIAAYWQLLSTGQSAISRVPAERWGYENNFHAGLINRLGHFDAAYFSLPEEDVRAMDPQALLLMEECLSACYHAGYEKEALKGAAMGVYIGGRSQHHPGAALLSAAKNPIVTVGPNYLATNISRFFDFRGPSLVVDTACSSALVSMNLAVQALRSGEITGALVGGVNLLSTDLAHQLFLQRNLLSTDGVFHIFDQRAAGVVLGEGAGMVLLKKVSQAMADGDKIYAVINGIAVNNDGKTAGPATPNMQAQQTVMEQALARSGKVAGDIGYIEANGSGSEITDLLELKAMMAVYGARGSASCGVGSVKPNIGHPLCAEGIAGFIKLLLMLEHRQEAPFLSGQQGLQHFDMAASPFRLNRQLSPLTTDTVALSSFADGGTNAHVILSAAGTLATAYTIKRAPLLPPVLNRQPAAIKGVRITEQHIPAQVNATSKATSIWKSKMLKF